MISAWFEPLLQDFRTGFRILWKAPALSATAIFLVALVIGGNTSIYSMIHALITKPAPGVEARDLVTLAVANDPSDGFHSFPDFVEYSKAKTIGPLVATETERFTLSLGGGSFALIGAGVTPNYFQTLRVSLQRGRPFSDADSTDLVAVISDRLWRERFDAAGDIVGRAISINGHTATVIGVAAPRFNGAALPSGEDLWVPIVTYARTHGKERSLTDRRFPSGVVIIGPLKAGVTMAEAQAEFSAISVQLASAYPETNKDRRIALQPYSAMIFAGLWVEAARFLAIFSVVTTITLLIVCANVANLLLARAVVRQRETAVRQSLGAPRVRILRMLFAEGLSLSLAAWAVSCLVAYWVSRLVPYIIGPPEVSPLGFRPNLASMDFSPDWQVLAYAMLLALVGTLAFSFAPALRTWRQDVFPSLKAGEPGVARGRSRVSNVLVVAQLAFSVLLLTSTGLAYRSIALIDTGDVYFDEEDVVLVTVNPTLTIRDRQSNLDLLDRSQERLAALPGVTSVSYVRYPPPNNWSRDPVQGGQSDRPIIARTNFVGPDFLRSLGLKPIAGREIEKADRTRSTKVAVINKHLADILWPGQNAVGQFLRVGTSVEPVEVVGIAPNAYYSGIERDARPKFVFLSEQQDPAPPTGEAGVRGSGATTFYLKHAGRADARIPLIGSAMRDIDASIPIVSIRTMEAQLQAMTTDVRVATVLLTIFAAISLLIAAIGQYAVIAFDMGRRTREFGVRVAIGASSRQILSSVLRQGLTWTAVGLLVGFLLSAGVATALRSILFGVTPTDPLTYLGVFALLGIASLFACYLPARRASRADPLAALRSE